VLLNLATIEYERKNFEKAKEVIGTVSAYDLKPLVKSELDKLVKKINDAQQEIE